MSKYKVVCVCVCVFREEVGQSTEGGKLLKEGGKGDCLGEESVDRFQAWYVQTC